MRYWQTRYTVAGWVFIGGLLILLRTQPGPLPDLGSMEDVWKVTLTLVGLFAGVPLGHLLYSLVEFGHRRILGGNGRFVDHRRFRSGLSGVIAGLLDDRQDREPKEAVYRRIQRLLDDRDKFPDRVPYILFLQSSAAQSFRDGCERRWESVHVYWSFVCGLLLAVVVSLICVGFRGQCVEYWLQNWWILLIMAIYALLMLSNARLLAKQAADQENLWIELFLTKVHNEPERLLDIFESPG